MTDEDETDICGVETTDGSPCQNRAGENGNCWIPSHNDPEAENPHGRDFTITEDDHEDILEAARDGMSKAGCARAAGVAPNQLNRYLQSDENADFRQAFMRARHEGEHKLINGPLYNEQDAVREMDGQHARFLLSTSFDYVKTEKKELEDVTEGSDGFGTTIVLDSEYTDDE